MISTVSRSGEFYGQALAGVFLQYIHNPLLCHCCCVAAEFAIGDSKIESCFAIGG